MKISKEKTTHSQASEIRPDTQVKLNMTFEQAVKKALNTALPKKELKKKK